MVSIDRYSPTQLTTNADSLTWRVTFSESISGIGRATFNLNGGNITAKLKVAGRINLSYLIEVTDIPPGYNGPITLGFVLGQAITDLKDNKLTDTIPTSGTNDNTFMLDRE